MLFISVYVAFTIHCIRHVHVLFDLKIYGGYLLGKSRSPSPSARRARKDSPTPATDIKGKKATVGELTKGKQTINVSHRHLMVCIKGTAFFKSK